MHRGYIKLYRAIMDMPDYLKRPFCHVRVWMDMLLLTNYKEGHIRPRGIKVPVLRGQLGWSIKRLSLRWGWSQGKVKRYFDELENDEQIVQQKNNVTSVITIINYDIYQGDGEQTESRRRADGEQTETNKKDKKFNKEKKKEKYLSLFSEEFQESTDFVTVWLEWLKYKSERQKKMTETTATKQAAFLSSQSIEHAIKIINNSISNSWMGLFPLKEYELTAPAHAVAINEDEIPWDVVEEAERGVSG